MDPGGHPLLHPLIGSVVTPEAAPRVVAPPYDALTPEQRRELAASEPDSFLNALPATEPDAAPDPQLDATLVDCRATVERLLLEGHYVPVDRPFLAVLRAAGPGHVQTGVVADLDLAAVDGDRVRPHEEVRDHRVAQLARYLEVVGVASSPVCVGHHPSPALAEVVAAVTATAPTVVAPPGPSDDTTTQSLWVVDEPATVDRLGQALATIGRLYLTDGHHRTAAARQHADAAGVGVEHRAGRLLVALFPTDELRILGFHRLVATGPVDLDALGAALADRGWTVRDGDDAPVVLRSGGRRLAAAPPAAPDPPAGTAVVDQLPVRWFERDVLGELGIAADDERVAPVAAARGTSALDAPDHLGVQLGAPDLATFVAAADAGVTLPAKSTYFWPKARSGMLLVPRHA